MDFKKLISRYRQFGGFRLVVEYAKLGVLGAVAKGFFRCLIKRQPFKGIYPEVLKKIEPYLIERYSPIVLGQVKRQSRAQEFKGSKSSNLEYKRSKLIWFCWLQGIEQAPEIVKACYNSLKRYLTDREIKMIDSENWKDYVELPECIVRKWEKNRIPAALFSDLLRLELLVKYGGTWIDSTVLCTGLNDNQNENEKFLDADLFLFQYTNQGSIPVSISNWFITAYTNNEVLIVLRDMLYAYWKDYDCTLDYYIFHLFFSMLSKEYSEEVLAMPYGQSMNSLALLHHWGENFDQKKWDKLTRQVSFHKLAFRVNENIMENKENWRTRIFPWLTSTDPHDSISKGKNRHPYILQTL